MIKFDLHKKFNSHGTTINIGLNAACEEGKIIAIYGKSGVGKSSLLRMLSGLMTPDKGSITVDNEVWYDSQSKKNIKANKRNIGFLFQDYSLFPNMSVLKNILYGVDANYDKEFINRIIAVSDLKDLLNRSPETLSGGQQQRVALARAIARKPKLLLLDEPLSALDGEMRLKLQKEILAINKIIKTTVIFVSHDLPEVFKLADEVLVVENGAFTKRGTPSEVFVNKKTDLMGEFISMDETEKSMQILVEGKIVSINLPG
ncbi:MAG: ATP-binding cassette domain-containing protein [Flavobacteriales bacterium]